MKTEKDTLIKFRDTLPPLDYDPFHPQDAHYAVFEHLKKILFAAESQQEDTSFGKPSLDLLQQQIMPVSAIDHTARLQLYVSHILSNVGISDYATDVIQYTSYKENLNSLWGQSAPIEKPAGLNKLYFNDSANYILPFLPISQLYERTFGGLIRTQYYEPIFCHNLYHMIFDHQDNIQIFKASNAYHLSDFDTTIQSKTRKFNEKLTEYPRLENFARSSNKRISLEEAWFFEKMTGFNLAHAINNVMGAKTLDDTSKSLIRTLLRCEPLGIRFDLAYYIFNYWLRSNDEKLVQRLELWVDEINMRFRALCELYLPYYDTKLNSRLHDVSILINEDIIIFNTRFLVYPIYLQGNVPSDQNLSGTESRAFAELQHFILGESFLMTNS